MGIQCPDLFVYYLVDGHRSAVQSLMSDVAIRDRHELHRMPSRGEERGRTRRSYIAVVGMSPECNHTNLLALREQGSPTGQHEYQCSHAPRILPHSIMLC